MCGAARTGVDERHMLHRRHFTRAQANALLPVVGATLRRLRDAREQLSGGGFDTDLALNAESTGGAWPGRERASAALVVTLGFEQLEELEVLVRDLDRGLVDFPSLVDGREVYLCWQLGEPEILHWHGLESGYAGRRPLTREARF
jgi:Uncharacterized conserved protein (DUF2203)